MSDFFWPSENEPGLYLVVESGGGFCPIQWDGKSWIAADGSELSHDILKAWGYLGVRREPAKENTEDDEDKATAEQENYEAANLAIDEWRTIQHKPAEVERWAYRWAVDLCERLGAR
jgi:hypothetical protein